MVSNTAKKFLCWGIGGLMCPYLMMLLKKRHNGGLWSLKNKFEWHWSRSYMCFFCEAFVFLNNDRFMPKICVCTLLSFVHKQSIKLWQRHKPLNPLVSWSLPSYIQFCVLVWVFLILIIIDLASNRNCTIPSSLNSKNILFYPTRAVIYHRFIMEVMLIFPLLIPFISHFSC